MLSSDYGPPLPAWFDGREDVGRFLADRVFATPWRLVPIAANGQPAFACYQYDGQQFRLGAVNVLSLRNGQISWIAGLSTRRRTAVLTSPRRFLRRTDESGVHDVSHPVTHRTPR